MEIIYKVVLEKGKNPTFEIDCEVDYFIPDTVLGYHAEEIFKELNKFPLSVKNITIEVNVNVTKKQFDDYRAINKS